MKQYQEKCKSVVLFLFIYLGCFLSVSGEVPQSGRWKVLVLGSADMSSDLLWLIKDDEQSERLKEIVSKNPSLLHPPEGELAPLIRAVDNEKTDLVRYFLEKGADVNRSTSEGWAPLYYAASRGNDDIVRVLIEAGADVHAKTEDGETALHRAAYYADQPSVRMLIEAGADVNAKTIKGETPLHEAAKNGTIASLHLLVESGADVNVATDEGHTPLYVAAKQGNMDFVRFLIEKGSLLSVEPSPLYAAAYADSWEIFQYLLEQGGEPSDWEYILEVALWRGNFPIIYYIMDRVEVDLNKKTPQLDALPLELLMLNWDEDVYTDEEALAMIHYLIQKGVDPACINEESLCGKILHIKSDRIFDYFLELGFQIEEKIASTGRPYLIEMLDECFFPAARYFLRREEGEPFYNDKPLILYFADGYRPTTPILEFLIEEKVNTAWYPQAFFQSIKENDLPSVLLFLRNGVDLNVKDEQGRNALFYVNDPDMAEYLILQGIDVSDPVTNGQILLNMPVLSMFMKWGIPVSMTQEQKDRALRKAARLGKVELVDYFLHKGADVNGREPFPQEWNKRGQEYEAGTPLIANARQGYEVCTSDWKRKELPDVAIRLIEAGADVHAEDEEGMTALEYAMDECVCVYNRWPLVRGSREEWYDTYFENFHSSHPSHRNVNHSLIASELIRAGADVNRLNQKGDPPLIVALHDYRLFELVPLLLEYGADVHFRTPEGMTPLLFAARWADMETLRVLLEAGASMNVRSEKGETPLMLAIQRDDPRACKMLLEAGCDPDITDTKGETAFHKINQYVTFSQIKEIGYADRVPVKVLEDLFEYNLYRYADTLIMDDLLAHGVSIHQPFGEEQHSALFCLMDNSFVKPSLITALIRRGILVDVTDAEGRTPLMKAIEEKYSTHIVKCLLSHGADPYKKDKKGRNAFGYAEENEELLRLLQETERMKSP